MISVILLAAAVVSLPEAVVGVWARDQMACEGNPIYDDEGNFLEIDDPIERMTFARSGKYNQFETSGQATRVEQRGINYFVYFDMQDESGGPYRVVLRMYRVGENLRLQNLDTGEGASLLVRCDDD